MPEKKTNESSSQIKKLIIQEGISEIDCHFRENIYLDSIRTVELPAGIKSIHQTFSGTDIQSITIPQSVTEIEDNAFEKCFSLTEITMNDGITAIGSQAFYECTALKKITIPSSVRSIGKDAFEAMDCLEKFTNNSSVTCILPTHRSGGRKLLQTFYLNKKAVSQVRQLKHTHTEQVKNCRQQKEKVICFFSYI